MYFKISIKNNDANLFEISKLIIIIILVVVDRFIKKINKSLILKSMYIKNYFIDYNLKTKNNY